MIPGRKWLPLLAILALGACDSEKFGTTGVPQIRLSHDALVFPATRIGDTSQEYVTIYSEGEKALEVTRIYFDPEIPEFRVANMPDMPLVLEPGMQRDISIEYSPQELGSNPTTTLYVESNDSVASLLAVPVSVMEHQPKLARDPKTLTWGYDDPRDENLGCQETINRKEITLTNEGSGQLLITGYDLQGEDLPEGEIASDHFSVCPADGWDVRTIGDGAGNVPSQVWTVVFHPKTAGEKRAKLTIRSNGGTVPVILKGGGEGRSVLEVSPMELSWPELDQGSEGAKTLVLTNVGTLPIEVSNIRIMPSIKRQFYGISGDGFEASEDGASGRLTSPIQKNESVRLSITYRASQPEPVEAELEIYHSAESPPSPVKVQLRGNSASPHMLVDPIQLLYSGTAPGTDSERTMVITNTGRANLVIDRIEIGPDGETQGYENFTCHPDPCSAELGPNEYKTFRIVYHRPLDAVQLEDRGLANIFTNDPDQQPSFPVSLIARNTQGNLPPVAVIDVEPGTTVDVDTEVTLRCDRSYDPDDGQSISRCDWVLTDRPAASHATLDEQTTELDEPNTFTPDVPGVYRVVLVVTDDSPTQFVSPEESVEITAR